MKNSGSAWTSPAYQQLGGMLPRTLKKGSFCKVKKKLHLWNAILTVIVKGEAWSAWGGLNWKRASWNFDGSKTGPSQSSIADFFTHCGKTAFFVKKVIFIIYSSSHMRKRWNYEISSFRIFQSLIYSWKSVAIFMLL